MDDLIPIGRFSRMSRLSVKALRFYAEQELMLRFPERLIDRGGKVMPYEVTVKEVAARPVAALTLRAGLATIGEAIQHGFGTVIGAVGTAGATPDGAPFVVYHAVIDEETEGDVEICVPVPAGTTLPDGMVRYYEIPAGTVASTIHRGPYQEISPAYHVVTGWIEEHGATLHGAPREIYLNDPQTVTPDDLLTEIQFPIEAAPAGRIS